MFLIYVATGMSLVPFSWLWRKATQYLPYQYEFGMLAVLLALGHVIIILIGRIDLELMRLIGFEFHLVLQKYVMSKHGFGLANLVGVIALSYGAILAITSNEAVFWCWACGIFVNFRVFDDLVKEPKT